MSNYIFGNLLIIAGILLCIAGEIAGCRQLRRGLIFHFFCASHSVKIDWVKNSKFRKLFGKIILHIFPNFDDDCMKTLGGVRANARNMLILSIRLTPVTLTLVGRPRPYCPEVTFININISWMFRENQIMARGSKGCDGQTDRRTSKNTWCMV